MMAMAIKSGEKRAWGISGEKRGAGYMVKGFNFIGKKNV